MKLIALLMLCACAAAAPNAASSSDLATNYEANRSWLIDQGAIELLRQLEAYVRRVIQYGYDRFDIPPLDPLSIKSFHLSVPAGLINLELDLEDIRATGLQGFVVHSSNLNLRELTLEVDVAIPLFHVSAGLYDMVGDLFTAIPLYGKGRAEFIVDGLRLRGKMYLKQSADGKSVLIERIEEPSFILPAFKSKLTGVIGGGDIDAVVNAVIEEVAVSYVNRFHGYISSVVTEFLPGILNPFLDQLDTWKYIDTTARPPNRP